MQENYKKQKLNKFLFFCAQGGARTRMHEVPRPSTVCVYQFHHLGIYYVTNTNNHITFLLLSKLYSYKIPYILLYMSIFKYIGYALHAKRGIERPDEFIADISFAPLETFFIVSFIILGLITLGLGFLAFLYASNILLIFALLFLTVLSIDIFFYIKIRRAFIGMGKKVQSFSKKKMSKLFSKNDEIIREEIVDIEYEIK